MIYDFQNVFKYWSLKIRESIIRKSQPFNPVLTVTFQMPIIDYIWKHVYIFNIPNQIIVKNNQKYH